MYRSGKHVRCSIDAGGIVALRFATGLLEPPKRPGYSDQVSFSMGGHATTAKGAVRYR